MTLSSGRGVWESKISSSMLMSWCQQDLCKESLLMQVEVQGWKE